MPKFSQSHPYSDRQSFERLMLLITTIIRNPGVGSADSSPEFLDEEKNHDSIRFVKEKLNQISQEFGFEIDYSIPTIRKDMLTLRNYGILDKRMYRWGYYLGTGVMNKEELSIALNALASLAEYQRSPNVMRTYASLLKRLQGFEPEGNSKFLYPVRAQINRSIVHTNFEEMASKKQYKNTLFHVLDTVETAITQGQAVEICSSSDPYGGEIGLIRVYVLQLIYHDIAWYLLYEKCDTGHLVISRVDRFSDRCQFIKSQTRDLESQKKSLEIAHKLISSGWGLYLGNLEEQKLEREGKLQFENVKVRFFTPVIQFIEEGEKRHASQKINSKGKPKFIDFQVTLPPRSLNEFSHWVSRFADNALVLSPDFLLEKHRQSAEKLNSLYNL